ncbi:hypothetical protein COY62_04260 [bacterium (Candidatus Howlettbacteria) CG_4_10_14_0_8_um_filter_40_9]|nr:MAG: hypothetical protein COY62_04260 [bacterium (Candidatus Howlettbacteria) CG_4_10_14_0_8_um_filter_40_9]
MNLSWDFFIMMFFVVMTVYGLLLGKSRVFGILLNTYAGFVIAQEGGEIVFNYIKRAASINGALSTSYFGAKLLTFTAVVFILTLKGELSGYEDRGMHSTVMTAIYGFLSAGLILSSVFAFMGETEKQHIISVSSLASQVADYRLVWLVAPIGAVIVAGFLRGKGNNPRNY